MISAAAADEIRLMTWRRCEAPVNSRLNFIIASKPAVVISITSGLNRKDLCIAVLSGLGFKRKSKRNNNKKEELRSSEYRFEIQCEVCSLLH
jgi:hypothetical protein